MAYSTPQALNLVLMKGTSKKGNLFFGKEVLEKYLALLRQLLPPCSKVTLVVLRDVRQVL